MSVLRAGVFSDSELDPCQCGPRRPRPKHRHRPRPEEAARARGAAGVKYTDFGFIDKQRDTGVGGRQDNR